MTDYTLKAKCDCTKHTGPSLEVMVGLYQTTGKLSWSHNHIVIKTTISERREGDGQMVGVVTKNLPARFPS